MDLKTPNCPKGSPKKHIGDGVFVEIERGMLKLTTQRGAGGCGPDTVYLEKSVFLELTKYAATEIGWYSDFHRRLEIRLEILRGCKKGWEQAGEKEIENYYAGAISEIEIMLKRNSE